jgi:hypothetical protein
VGINEELEPLITLQHWKTTQKAPFPQVLKKGAWQSVLPK